MDPTSWPNAMTGKTLRTVSDLASAGFISGEQAPALEAVAGKFAIAIPSAVADLIRMPPGNDPIARQYIPDLRELENIPSESSDPIGDRRHMPIEGIVHRYRDRVLLKVVHVCPVYCRFCFRREMVGPGKDANLSPEALAGALAYIRSHPEIREVILTGGDPFILATHRIADLTQSLAAIPQVQLIRWHTRVPVVEPQKIDEGFVAALKSTQATTFVALHANHPGEFTPDAERALAALADAGIPLLSQSVLLKSVNDDPETLQSLMLSFLRNRVRPYYLHHADLAPGTSHFRTTIAHGRQLLRQLRAKASGMAVPSYVLDIPGGYSKVDLETDAAVEVAHGQWRLRDDTGTWHDYLEDPVLFG